MSMKVNLVFHAEHSPTTIDSWTISAIVGDSIQYGFGDSFLEAMQNIADLIMYYQMLREYCE